MNVKRQEKKLSAYKEHPIEYRAWHAMRSRCSNSNHMNWNNYGGRGISVCDRWQNSFEAFLADMGKRPTEGHSLDRINNDGNYEPGNCRWAKALVQANNQRKDKKRGREKIYTVRIILPLTAEMSELIEGALEPRETRVDFIRTAIAWELEEREKSAKLKQSKANR